MQHGKIIDENYNRYVGYSNDDSEVSLHFFNENIINIISEKISQLLEGVDEEGHKLVVPNDTITHVMSNVYENHNPNVGCIHSRYNDENKNHIQNMIDEVIGIISNTVRNELEIEKNNKKLNIWTTVLGDFNTEGLRSHSKIKLRENRPISFQFNMNY
tara:strand:+ start:47 stop:520 length:474 start_codon:yes stop_codon:yes gene_type:complete